MKQDLNARPFTIAKNSHVNKIPLLGEYGVHAFARGAIDINSFLIGRSGATSFIFEVTTNDFLPDGIVHGDSLLVDTDLIATNGDLIISANENQYRLMRQTDTENMHVWAVVTGVIRKLTTNTA